jgi:hypothetical protein
MVKIAERAEQQRRLIHTLSTRIDAFEWAQDTVPGYQQGSPQQQQQQQDGEEPDSALFRQVHSCSIACALHALPYSTTSKLQLCTAAPPAAAVAAAAAAGQDWAT